MLNYDNRVNLKLKIITLFLFSVSIKVERSVDMVYGIELFKIPKS